ncbi:MAG: thiolase domain-containing protein [Deltaproteobacteria bacterium]|nr:thiolase domain-containing protein [Deltaproteobacteria bacterium]
MIRFSERNLAPPKQMRPVYAVAAGQSDFRKRYPGKKTEELAIEAFRMLALENGLKVESVQELRSYIHSAYYGHFADHFGDQLLGEAQIHDRLGLDPLANAGIKTGGATGGSTVWMAANAVASGYSDCVLALGWERMDEVDTRTGNHYIAAAADRDFETELGHTYTGYYALMAQRYWNTLGGASEAFRHTLSKIAVKQRGYAWSNPFAQTHQRITVEDVERSPFIADPLRFYDACLMSVGAAAVLLCDEETAYKLSDDPIRLFVAAGSHTLRAADRRPIDIPLLPHERNDAAILQQYRDLYGDGKERFPGYTGFLAARMAAHYAYGMTGITNPIEELDMVELHDAFTISDVQTYEDIGLRPYGSGADFIESGDAYHTNPLTGLPGRCPGNVSGGLLGTMHAIGATGIMQVNEILWQLQGKWAHFHDRPELWERFGKTRPDDIEDLQIRGARRGMAVSHAGVGSHVTCAVLSRPEAILK